jgi:diguanylate cyclase (GGDEF)-like protein
MICPKCSGQMQSKNIDEIEIDICSECSGIFLDDGEFQSFTGMDPTTGAVKLAKFAKVLAKLNERAILDELTGVFSRKYFNEYMAGIFANIKRGRVTLISLDVDHFKSVNTEFGHDGGDAALKAVAQRLKTSMRSSRDDGVFRVGGEEFCVVLLELNAADSYHTAENLRRLVQMEPVKMPDGREKQLTLSAGVAFARESDTPDTLYKRADELLYQAKETGRNRVVVETEA